jgi:hypothetical protein
MAENVDLMPMPDCLLPKKSHSSCQKCKECRNERAGTFLFRVCLNFVGCSNLVTQITVG